jgi:glycopeptide antibiotics resistance protein
VLRRHPVLSLLTVAYGVALAILTLTPAADGERVYSLLTRLVALFERFDRTDWITYGVAEFAANIVLFVPLGVLLVLLLGRRRWLAVIVAGLLASCWIELAQGIWIGDRVADSRDLVSNTLGTAIGVVLAMMLTWPAATRDRRLAAARTARHAEA